MPSELQKSIVSSLSALLVHHHHHVVGRLIIHQQLTITVVNGTTGRELNLLQEGITVGILLIVVAHNLKRKQTNDVNDHNSYGHSTNNKSTLFKIVIHHTLLYIAKLILFIFFSHHLSASLSLAEALQ